MSHENEYYENMVTMLELIWGDGYMAPGGPGNVAKLLDGIDTQDKRILDIGCGIGGPVFEMAKAFASCDLAAICVVTTGSSQTVTRTLTTCSIGSRSKV